MAPAQIPEFFPRKLVLRVANYFLAMLKRRAPPSSASRAGIGKSMLLSQALGRLRALGEASTATAARPRVIVAQSSQVLAKCDPLGTARQFLGWLKQARGLIKNVFLFVLYSYFDLIKKTNQTRFLQGPARVFCQPRSVLAALEAAWADCNTGRVESVRGRGTGSGRRTDGRLGGGAWWIANDRSFRRKGGFAGGEAGGAGARTLCSGAAAAAVPVC